MKEYLVFRLYGPMASWGDIAVGENRHSFSYPSKSAIIGLIASALGYKREEEEKHTMLSLSLGFGVKVWSSGILLRDYHTAQTIPSKGKHVYSTRKDELRNKIELNTILSSRDYRMDALYDVCIWIKKEFVSIQNLQEALKNPKFTLYLGRKSCVIASPLFPNVIKENNIFNTFAKFETELKERFQEMDTSYFFGYNTLNNSFVEYLWEEESEELSEHIQTRRDEVLSRKKWQFRERKEFYKSEASNILTKPKGVTNGSN